MDLTEILKAMGMDEALPKLSTDLAQKEKRTVHIPDIKLDGSEESNQKNLVIVEEIARALTEQEKYYEASSLLEVVADHQEISNLATKLAMGECFLSLGREAKAMRCIEAVRDFLLTDPAADATEVFLMAQSMTESKSYLRALILFPVAAKLYERSADPEDALEGMFRCIKFADDCTCPMINEGGRARVLAVDFGLAFMEECLESILKIEGVDQQKLSFKHCLVATLTGFIYWSLNENAKGIKVREKAVAHMEKAFGPNAGQRRIYANAYYNIGVGYDILSKNEKARAAYVRSIEAAEQATDFDNEVERQKELKQYRQKLREL